MQLLSLWKSISKPIENKESIAQVATISAADEGIGKLIADAMEKVGKDGVITVEESKTTQTYLSTVDGMQFDRGYLSAYMVTDTEKMVADLDNPYILLQIRRFPACRNCCLCWSRLYSRAESF